MAGDWLKIEANTPEKEEVLAITAHLGWDDADLTVGKLFRLWRWFDQQTISGNAARVTPALLDRIVGVTGFCEAMREVGWLEIADHGITLPKFDRHNGTTAKSRAQTAKRVAKHKSNGQSNAEGNARSVSAPLPREEKRREEETPPNPRRRGKRADGFDASLIDLPDWVQREAWAMWCADRKKRGKAITEAGARLQIKALETYRNEGHSAQSVIEHSIAGGYQGLFPKKQRSDQAAAPDPADWRATWRTIVAKGVEVGVGEWSEDLQAQGKAPAFPEYRARVERRVAEIEAGGLDRAGVSKIAEIIGAAMKKVA